MDLSLFLATDEPLREREREREQPVSSDERKKRRLTKGLVASRRPLSLSRGDLVSQEGVFPLERVSELCERRALSFSKKRGLL